MTFDAWLKEVYKIDLKTFSLRHPNLQCQIIEEYNESQHKLYSEINT